MSGRNERRKAAAEKAQKLDEQLAKTPKLSSFLQVLEQPKTQNHDLPSTSNPVLAPVLESEKQDEPAQDCQVIERLAQHETSKSHLNSLIDFSTRSKKLSCINYAIDEQVQEEARYWREVLKRVISAIEFLAERGLFFRGTDETIGSPSNVNFLGIIELLAQYDPFLASHLKEHGLVQKYTNKY